MSAVNSSETIEVEGEVVELYPTLSLKLNCLMGIVLLRIFRVR